MKSLILQLVLTKGYQRYTVCYDTNRKVLFDKLIYERIVCLINRVQKLDNLFISSFE